MDMSIPAHRRRLKGRTDAQSELERSLRAPSLRPLPFPKFPLWGHSSFILFSMNLADV